MERDRRSAPIADLALGLERPLGLAAGVGLNPELLVARTYNEYNKI